VLIAELEEENSLLKTTTIELQRSVDSSAEDVASLQHSLEAGIDDYDLLLEGHKSLLAECNTLCDHPADLESALEDAKAITAKDIAALEARVISTESHVVDEAVAEENVLPILTWNLLMTWWNFTRRKSILSKASEASARRCLRINSRLQIMCAGWQQK
jgi:hypothetical protein